MPGLDVEDIYETDSSDNEENYSKLLSSVSQLDSTQRIKPAQRKELATIVSEYNLNKGSSNQKNLIKVKELVGVLGKKPEHGVITKKITDFTKKHKVLPKPLDKPVEERIKRSIGFDNVKKDLGKWDAIVTRNALKDQISFPLNDNSMKMQKSNEFLSQFKTPTSLETELAKVLKQENSGEQLEEDEFPLTYDEMLEKRKEMAQLRAKLSYRQTKAQRQSKIKSKKYHRLLKREKIKQQLKEFEILQKTDPEAALKKLAELDKTRAKERASLRHRNTGKWAKNLTVRAKYDVETRKVLADQLKMSRELTQKVSQLDVSEDEEDDPVPQEKNDPAENSTVQSTTDNPWMINVSEEVQEFVNDYKNFWDKNGEKINQNESQEKQKQCNGISETTDGSAMQNEKKSTDNEEVKKTPSPKTENSKKKTNNTEKAEVSLNNTENSPESIKTSNENNISAKNKKNGAKKKEIETKETKNNSKKAEIIHNNQKTNSKETDNSPEKIETSAKKNIKNSTKKEISSQETEKALKNTKCNSKKAENGLKNKKNSSIEIDIDAKKIKIGSEKMEVSPKNSKTSPKKEKTCIIAHPTSGVWMVTPVPGETNSKSKNKRKAEDLDVLFDELNENLLKKAAKKVEKIKSGLKRGEKKEKVRREKKAKKEIDLSFKNTNRIERPDLDEELLEGGAENSFPEITSAYSKTDVQKSEPDPTIDPKNFIQITPKRLNTGLPENITEGEDGVDNEKTQQMIIEEAFVDDDVVAEFNNEMKEEEEKNKIQIDNTLPGWGAWGGAGLKVKRARKKPLLVLNIPSKKKKHLKDTFFYENGNPNLKNHLVKDVPHPFKSVEAFEANIRVPVGRDWVPETAHRKLIEKQVVTKLGTVIEPMSENEIIQLQKTAKSPYQGKKKKANS